MRRAIEIKYFLICFSFMFIAFTGFAHAEISSQHYAKISDDLTMFYQDVGKGPTLLFIPGWTMSSDVFKAQLDHFSKKYRVIAIDPRSQGLSSITLDNNNYTQHGRDLAGFIDKLNLKNITMIGWSWGCYDAYSYIRLKGVGNLKAFVCADVSPKSSGNKDEWAYVNYDEWGAKMIYPMMHHRTEFTQSWGQGMVERKLKPEEIDWIANQSMHTPTFAALGLALDGIYSDYRPEAIFLDKNNIPTLNVVSQPASQNATIWLKDNMPHTVIKVLGKHMMFWEYPDQFNQILDEFLIGK